MKIICRQFLKQMLACKGWHDDAMYGPRRFDESEEYFPDLVPG